MLPAMRMPAEAFCCLCTLPQAVGATKMVTYHSHCKVGYPGYGQHVATLHLKQSQNLQRSQAHHGQAWRA